MKDDVLIPCLIATGMISVFIIISSGPTLLVTFVPGVIIALAFYFLTVYKKQPEPDKILPLYLFALGIQFFHFSEEYLNGFHYKFPALFDAPEYPIDLFVVFNMIAYFAFLMGAIMIYKKIKPPMIIPLFFVIYGVVGNGIAHVIFAIVVGGYFPGLYTALIYWILGPLLLKRIWMASK